MTKIKNNIEKKDWKNSLTNEQYRITRESGTERPFTGPYLNEKGEGVYRCICCNTELFSSKHKFDSGSGWPSFFDPHNSDCINLKNDNSLNTKRVEACCSNCDAHLGHLFEDGPAPTGLRYCINGNSLKLVKENK